MFIPYFQPTVNQTHFDLHLFTTKPYMFTNFIFSGESICGDKLCEKLFEVFSNPLASKIFQLDIPSPEKLPLHQMSRNMSIQAEQNKKLKKGSTSQCLTSITKTEEHSIILSPKPQNQSTAEKSLYPLPLSLN